MNSGDTFIALVCICLKHSEVTEKSGSIIERCFSLF